MFYDKVKYLCDKEGISLTELTKQINIASSNVVDWKKGSTPRAKTIKAIADFFKIDVSYFSSQLKNQGEELLYNYIRGESHTYLTAALTDFPQRLLKEMALKKITKEKMAELLNTTVREISSWINRYSQPNIIFLLKICFHLEKDPNYMLGFNEITRADFLKFELLEQEMSKEIERRNNEIESDDVPIEERVCVDITNNDEIEEFENAKSDETIKLMKKFGYPFKPKK